MTDCVPATELRARRVAPRPLLRASLALHVGAAAAVVARPGLWPFALGAIAADHLCITAVGLWPRSRLLGPNRTQLPPGAGAAIALTIDDGPDPQVTPRVLDLLEAHKAQATFFCIGTRVRAHPALTREILARGHAIGNHSERHDLRFALMGPRAMAKEVLQGQATLREVTGTDCRFFRAPAGLRNPFLEPILARAGLELVSWTRRAFDTVNGDAARVLHRLTRALAPRDILLLHDGHAARTREGTPVILAVLPQLIGAARARGLEPVPLGCSAVPAGTA